MGVEDVKEDVLSQSPSGKVMWFQRNWKAITSDQWVLNCVQGYEIEWVARPSQICTPRELVFPKAEDVDLTLALTRCSCSALREVGVFVRECGKCKPLYASVIERCVTLPVGTWSVARKESFASTAVTCTMSQLRTSSERKLSFSATRQPFTVEIALLFVFSLSNSLFFVPFFVYPAYHIHKSKPGTCLGCKR